MIAFDLLLMENRDSHLSKRIYSLVILTKLCDVAILIFFFFYYFYHSCSTVTSYEDKFKQVYIKNGHFQN